MLQMLHSCGPLEHPLLGRQQDKSCVKQNVFNLPTLLPYTEFIKQ
jgi:hypothetical protein